MDKRLVIVSNRLPIVLKGDKIESGSGGLVTALAPVLKNRGGLWIGWPGLTEGDETHIREKIVQEGISTGFSLQPIFLTKEQVQLYYDGFANGVIWPLFHDMESMCHFNPDYWTANLEVNKKFAETIHQHVLPDDFIWVHDYHLLMVGQELRKLKVPSKLAFFLHIPFPSPDIFVKLPWRFQILKAILEYDLIGFQTVRDQKNFIQCVRKLLPEQTVEPSKTGVFPISIDYNYFSEQASSREVSEQAWYSHEKFHGQNLIFSVDRLDFTKGIPYRLEAIRHLFKNNPDLKEKVTFLQVVVPSRIDNTKYQDLKKEIDRLVGEINSEFSTAGWVPIHYFYRSITQKELIAFYRTCEIGLVTPLKDGMNLVAKEFIASNADENGVLILSEFAGAASQLHREALLINPYDIEGVAQTLFKALSLPEEDRKVRMRKMRRIVKRYDVFWWVQSFLKASISKDLKDFPLVKEYTPKDESPQQLAS